MNISAQYLKTLLKGKSNNIQIIDVRTIEEWNEYHIKDPRVINIDINKLRENLDKINQSKEIYVICKSGGRSGLAQMILSNFGIKSVNVSGGMNELESNI